MGLIKKLLTDSLVQRFYVKNGGNFGGAVSYMFAWGECIGFEKLLAKWGDWEKEYAGRGFRTVSLDWFINYGGYGTSLDTVLGVKRGASEEPVFHAELYREHFLGKQMPGTIEIIDTAVDVPGKDGNRHIISPTFTGSYVLPSTERILELKKRGLLKA